MHQLIVPEFDTVPQFKIAYLTMRKSGCTSIKLGLRQLRESTERVSTEPLELPAQIHQPHEFLRLSDQLESPDQWFKFTVVRDPILRFLSFYDNKVVHVNVIENMTLANRFRFGYLPNMLLDDAIDVLLDERFETEPHAISQSDILNAMEMELDYVGRLETIQNTVQTISDVAGCQLQIGHFNRRTNDYLMINSEQFAKLSEFYRNDQERFGYPLQYEDWCDTQINKHKFSFRKEHGFVFTDEAKLIGYSIKRERKRFVVDLKLRVSPAHSRNLSMHVISYGETNRDPRTLYLNTKDPVNLLDESDDAGIVNRQFEICFDQLPSDVPLEELFVLIFFWNKEQNFATIERFLGFNVPLAFPILDPPLRPST